MSRALRAFYALPVPDGPRRAFADAQERMRRANDSGRLPVRFTRAEQLHVTLKFLGDIDEELIPELSAIAARRAREHGPLTLSCTGIDAFGGPRRARALVVAFARSPELAQLASAIENDAAALGVPEEERAFRPHVTLARIKRPGDARRLLEAARLEPSEVVLDELRLYQSELTNDGGVYTVLATAKLGAS